MVKHLSDLVTDLPDYKVIGSKEVAVSGIENDSREVKEGYVFVAVKGLTVDGHGYITKAIQSGAKVVVCEVLPDKLDPKITYLQVADSRRTLGLLASAWFDNPSRKMKIIGVTGTDGKTTTVNIIYWLLKSAGYKEGLVSTVSAKIGNREYDTGFHVTNPEPIALQGFLAKMVEEGCEYAVLEVTSHGLDQERVAGIKFDVAVLTNITHEHLDYHKTFKDYVRAKAKLFANTKYAILNGELDLQTWKIITEAIPENTKLFEYYPSRSNEQYHRIIDARFTEPYNYANSLAAFSTISALGIGSAEIFKTIKTFPGVPGRMEEIPNKKGLKIVVDFAHTPNALENILTALKRKTNGKLVVVFGCAGERDKVKRPMMGEIATRIADFSVITAEDPRSEDVNEIITLIVKGVKNNNYIIKTERGEAIWFAINKLTKKGDTVVICGKGHEKSMCYGKVEYPWSDQKAVKLALKGKVMRIDKQVQS